MYKDKNGKLHKGLCMDENKIRGHLGEFCIPNCNPIKLWSYKKNDIPELERIYFKTWCFVQSRISKRQEDLIKIVKEFGKIKGRRWVYKYHDGKLSFHSNKDQKTLPTSILLIKDLIGELEAAKNVDVLSDYCDTLWRRLSVVRSIFLCQLERELQTETLSEHEMYTEFLVKTKINGREYWLQHKQLHHWEVIKTPETEIREKVWSKS